MGSSSGGGATLPGVLQGDQAEAETFFANLGVYLTLERAQRLYGFEAARYGLDDAQAADIAAVFARVGSLPATVEAAWP